MSSPLVSIITPVYQGGRFLAETMLSVSRQTYTDWEHIIVDDASSDDSAGIASAHGIPGKTRTIRHDTNRGIAASRNTGLEAATGRYVALLDQDDLWTPFKLSEQVRLLEEAAPLGSPPAAICFGRHAFFSRRGERVLISPARYPVHSAGTTLLSGVGGPGLSLFMENFIGAGSVVARRDLLLSAGGFDETLRGGGDDYDLWLRLSERTGFIMLDRTVLLSRMHAANYTDTMRMTGDVLRILESFEKRHHVPADVAADRYGSIHYKRFIALLDSGRYTEAREELDLAGSRGAGVLKRAAARALTSLGPGGAKLFLRLKRCVGQSPATGMSPSRSITPEEFSRIAGGLEEIA